MNAGSSDKGAPPVHAPIDFAHLDRQTFGDAAVQREVLALFADQAVVLVGLIGSAASTDDRRSHAHALVGAARGVGAFAVAEIAALIEHDDDGGGERICALERAVEDACAAIARRGSRNGNP